MSADMVTKHTELADRRRMEAVADLAAAAVLVSEIYDQLNRSAQRLLKMATEPHGPVRRAGYEPRVGDAREHIKAARREAGHALLILLGEEP